MGRKSKEEGIYVYVEPIHFLVQHKLTQHCKATILPFLKMPDSFHAPSESFLVRAGGSLRKHSLAGGDPAILGLPSESKSPQLEPGCREDSPSAGGLRPPVFFSPPTPPHPQVSCPHSPLFPSPPHSLSSTSPVRLPLTYS